MKMSDDSFARPFRRKFDASEMESDDTKQSALKSNSKSPSSSNNESQDEHGKLAQEIQDELLICKICLGNYNEPKSLSCLHTFCAGCLESHIQGEVTYKKYSDYRDFTCPLCRKKTSLPVGGVKKLPDNFVVASLFSMIQKRKSCNSSEIIDEQELKMNLSCQICMKTGNRLKEAQTKCIDCCKLLCRKCTERHKEMKVTKHHSLFDLNIEDEIICKIHNDESVRFFCVPCQTCICVVCTFNDHQEHEVTQFRDAVVKYKTEIEDARAACQTIISDFEEMIVKIAKVENIIKTTESEIRNMAVKLMIEVKNKEKQLLEEIHNIYGEQMLLVIQSKSAKEIKLCELKCSCNMADMVLQRKDVEVLLLKREIQEKLSEMNNLTVIELPATVSKEVKFIQGIMDFGCIQDMDRPLLTKPRSYKEYLENKDIRRPEMINADIQTDAVPIHSQSSKSTSTTPIQKANKAVNTRTKIVQHNVRANSLQTLNGSVGPLDEHNLTTSNNNSPLMIHDQIQMSPTICHQTYNYEAVTSPDTNDLVLNSSQILNEFITNTDLDSKICVDVEDRIPVSDL